MDLFSESLLKILPVSDKNYMYIGNRKIQFYLKPQKNIDVVIEDNYSMDMTFTRHIQVLNIDKREYIDLDVDEDVVYISPSTGEGVKSLLCNICNELQEYDNEVIYNVYDRVYDIEKIDVSKIDLVIPIISNTSRSMLDFLDRVGYRKGSSSYIYIDFIGTIEFTIGRENQKGLINLESKRFANNIDTSYTSTYNRGISVCRTILCTTELRGGGLHNTRYRIKDIKHLYGYYRRVYDRIGPYKCDGLFHSDTDIHFQLL